MKACFSVFAFLFLSLSVASSGTENLEEEVESLCHCVNDCDRQKKCEWVWDRYLSLSSSGDLLDETQKSILKKQKLSLLEMVDAGDIGCFTTFGLFETKFIRTDVEVNIINEFKVRSLQNEVNSIPSIRERKSNGTDDLCLFKFD